MQEKANVILIRVSLTLQIILNKCEEFSHCILCVQGICTCLCLYFCVCTCMEARGLLGNLLHLSVPYYLQSEAQDLTDLGAYQI